MARRYISCEHAVQVTLALATRHMCAKSPDTLGKLERGVVQVDGGADRGEVPDSLLDLADLLDFWRDVAREVGERRWRVWRSIRVERQSARQAARAHNERAGGSGAPELCISASTASRWSRAVDAVAEAQLADRHQLIRNAVGGDP